WMMLPPLAGTCCNASWIASIGPKDVGVDLAMALLLRHGLERLALQNSGIVHQHIHGAEDARRCFAHALHVGCPGDLSLEYDRLATMAGHLRHGAPRSLCI